MLAEGEECKRYTIRTAIEFGAAKIHQVHRMPSRSQASEYGAAPSEEVSRLPSWRILPSCLYIWTVLGLPMPPLSGLLSAAETAVVLSCGDGGMVQRRSLFFDGLTDGRPFHRKRAGHCKSGALAAQILAMVEGGCG
jgi:hypothetical protein